MKWKHLILIVAVILVWAIPFSKASSILFASTVDNFNVVFLDNTKLAFHGDNTLFINVTDGLLNGTSGSLTLWNNRGSFSFTATDNSTVEVSSPDAEEGFDISISGATSSELGDFSYQITIQTGNNVKIVWLYRLESYADKYTVLGIGIAGLALMICSPTWVALEFRRKGFDADSMEKLGYGLLLFVVGWGLLITWLWG